MDIEKRINRLQKEINTNLQQIFEGTAPKSLYEPMEHLLKAGGKRIRPLLVLFACEAAGGHVNDCFHAACGLELLHTFTLVHDDIMDDDDTRRGTPSVHTLWDVPTAILAGDGLVTLAFKELLKTRHPRIGTLMESVTEGLLVLCEGQALDKDMENSSTAGLDQYLDMIAKKTGRLIEVCCDAGALLGGASEGDRQKLVHFGRCIGRAFQIQDDLLDLYTDEAVSGKPVASDVIQKKNTYLTVHLWTNGHERTKETFRSFWGKPELSRDDIETVRECFTRAGSTESARNMVAQDLDSALKSIESLDSKGDVSYLTHIVRLIADRTY